MKARIAFFKYTGKPLNAAISAWTWLFNPFTPAYSHVEIGMPNKERDWLYFSSTNRGSAGGTRWISPEKLFKHPERWDVYETEVDSVDDLMERASEILGRKYDWWGIFGFLTPFGLINSRTRWYCSECVYYILTGSWRKRISPRRLYSYIKNNYLILKKVAIWKK